MCILCMYVCMYVQLTYEVASTWEGTSPNLGCFEGWGGPARWRARALTKEQTAGKHVHRSENRESMATASV